MPQISTKLLCAFSLMLVISASGFAQTVGACELKAVGLKDSRQLLRFDGELRNALKNNDPAKMALLVGFPLRVNGSRGHVDIPDAITLQARFDEVFPPLLRQKLLALKTDDIWCKYTGVAYGSGLVWLSTEDDRIRIRSVNLPEPDSPKNNAKAGRVEFTCGTKSQRSIVDSAADGHLRLRVWIEPHALVEKPDLEMSNGKSAVEGTDPCVHREWTFELGEGKYFVSTLGCTDDSPPDGAVGSISVSHFDGIQNTEEWCF